MQNTSKKRCTENISIAGYDKIQFATAFFCSMQIVSRCKCIV